MGLQPARLDDGADRPDAPPDALVPDLPTTSDVLGTGGSPPIAANVKPGATVAIVGDGAVGLLVAHSAKQMGAERIIAMSRRGSRQKLAREFGATDIVTERGDEGVEWIRDLTKGIGADSVLECVGTQESMMQAIRSARPGGFVSYVGVPHGVELGKKRQCKEHRNGSQASWHSALRKRPGRVVYGNGAYRPAISGARSRSRSRRQRYVRTPGRGRHGTRIRSDRRSS